MTIEMGIDFNRYLRNLMFTANYFDFKNGYGIRPRIELTEDEVIIEDVSDNSDSSSVENNIRTMDGQ